MWATIGYSPWGISKMQVQWGLGLRTIIVKKRNKDRLHYSPETLIIVNNVSHCIPQADIVRLLGPVRLALRSLTLHQLSDDLTHLPHWILSNVSLITLSLQTSSLKVRCITYSNNSTLTLQTSSLNAWCCHLSTLIHPAEQLTQCVVLSPIHTYSPCRPAQSMRRGCCHLSTLIHPADQLTQCVVLSPKHTNSPCWAAHSVRGVVTYPH